MKRILMFSLVLALLGAMVLSSAAFAGNGPGPGDCIPNSYEFPGPHGR